MGHLKKAIEIKPDFLEARFNLSELYALAGKPQRAVKELEAILGFKPEDLPTLRRLAQLYAAMGQEDRAREILEGSSGLGAMKAFIDSLWLGIKFYAMADGLSPRERLEKLMLAVLRLIDGQEGRSQAFRLVGRNPEDGQEIVLERLSEHFYYKESQELSGESQGHKPELILTIGDHRDWHFFHGALKAEMRAEGGCLGDFTQTRKVFRKSPELAKYDLDLTLRYFQANVGPCDCHVVRAVLV
jgi:tetratricopeptide (TPR) repeat protein